MVIRRCFWEKIEKGNMAKRVKRKREKRGQL
jgi:hypothetical protein